MKAPHESGINKDFTEKSTDWIATDGKRCTDAIVRYFNGILFVFTLLVFLKCVHYSTDFGTRMLVPAAMILLRLMLYEITLWANQQRRLFGTSRIRATRGASWLRLLGILPRSSAMAVNFGDLIKHGISIIAFFTNHTT